MVLYVWYVPITCISLCTNGLTDIIVLLYCMFDGSLFVVCEK